MMDKKEIKILNWNVGGGTFLKLPQRERSVFKETLNKEMHKLIEDYDPDFIALQEFVQFDKEYLLSPPDGYFIKFTPSIDTESKTSKDLWEDDINIKKHWRSNIYLGFGLATLWKKTIGHTKIWSLEGAANYDDRLLSEDVHLDTGLYTGTRNTEPRLAVVSHFVFSSKKNQFQHFFLINTHLTTLLKEREGVIDKDEEGKRIRFQQLDIIIYGIISRYNEWLGIEKKRLGVSSKQKQSNKPPLWIIAGDFNFTPDSEEYARMMKSQFIDLNTAKGTGTKGRKTGAIVYPSLTVDYIFAGPTFVAFNADDPKIRDAISNNPKPLNRATTVSDHFPLVATFPIFQ